MIKSRTSEGGASSEVSNPGQELDDKSHIQMQLQFKESIEAQKRRIDLLKEVEEND